MKARGRWTVGVVGAVLTVALVAGCGGDDDGGTTGEGAGATNTAGALATSEGAPSGSGAAATAPSNAPAGPGSGCPLSAEQVGEVLGVDMEQYGDCSFDGPSRSVIYVGPVPGACSDAVVRDPSFEMEPYDGLGVGAYSATQGPELLVCTDPPFSITVDITPSLEALTADQAAASAAALASEREAAEELARLILAGG